MTGHSVKIALCLEYPIDQFGGTEVLVSELIKGLAREHQIVLVSAETAESAKKSSVGRFLADHVHWNPASISLRQSQQLADALARAKVQVAHFHFGGNYGWGNRAFDRCPIIHTQRHGIPCVSTNHGAFSIFEGYCGPHRPFLKAALFLPAWLSKQYVLGHLRCEVAVSQYDYRALRSWYPPMRHKFRQIYHSRLHAPPPVITAPRRKAILCVGSIGLRKGQPLLVEAFGRISAKHPEWQLILIGRMADEQITRRIYDVIAHHNLGTRVQFLGGRPDAEVRQWLGEAAIFAMPSSHEGLGLSLQEALFYGCACVSTRAGGTVDLVDDNQNGLLVDAGNPGQLAEALDKLISDDALRARLAARAPQSILDKEMTVEKMVEKYQALYETVLKQR